ncbi:hypothetical protein AHV57_22295 [Salmonella enterica]|nr:hypothetical protein [Salmonella enterica]
MNELIHEKRTYDYHIHGLRFNIKKLTGDIHSLHIWKGNKPQTHNILIRGTEGKLSITIQSAYKFTIPSLENRRNRRQWFITIPQEYDITQFIYRIIQSPPGSASPQFIKPLKTFFGLSPEEERRENIKYRKNVKFLFLAFTRDVVQEKSDAYEAATQFSLCTGCDIKSARRYFSHVYFDSLLNILSSHRRRRFPFI